MTTTPSPVITRTDERGSALIMVLLLLMMMSALGAALAIGGQTETFISRNQRSGAQAHAAAEAGLNHAVELVTSYVFQWNANGHASPAAAANALLIGLDAGDDDDNGSLGTRPGIDAAEDIPAGTRLTITAGMQAQYEAFMMDDDATAPDENGDPTTDANERLIIRAIGYAQDNSEVTLEAIISPAEYGALVVNGDVELTGNVNVIGTEGDVHANGDLAIDGSANISGTASATGTYTGSEPGTGGAPPVDLPEVDPSDYRHYADFILTSDGRMTTPAGVTLCTWSNKTPCNNWEWNNGSNTWEISSAAPANGTYYVEGAVSVTGSPGTAKVPVSVTLIAEGSIDISGSPDFVADTPELLMVTGGDLEISGGLDTENDPLNIGGQILVHEQIKFSGNPYLFGQVIVENATSVDDLVTVNELSGTVEIEYNGGLGSATYAVSGWREVR
jgi:Tfp pilus assembly protein PilX